MAHNLALNPAQGAARVHAPRIPIGEWALTATVLAWFALLIFGPAVALTQRAFGAGFDRFLASLTSAQAIQAFSLTLQTTLAATICNTLFGIVIAIILVRHRFPGRAIIDGIVDLPFAVSPIVAGLMLVVLYGPQGLFGKWLEAHGVRVVYSSFGMILACVFVTIPFVIREIVPVLREYGTDQEAVAHTLGANRWITFWRVTLPSIRWGLAYGVALTVSRCLGEFGALLVVSGNVLGRTQTATLYVHDQIESFQPEGAYAVSLVLAGVSFFLLYGMEHLRKLREG
jgi:sulfate transport system permease protein